MNKLGVHLVATLLAVEIPGFRFLMESRNRKTIAIPKIARIETNKGTRRIVTAQSLLQTCRFGG